MKCHNCGNEISNDAVFCSKCRTRLDVGNAQKDMLPIDGRYGYTQTHERCWGSNSTMTPGQLGSSQGQEHDSSQDTKARAAGLYTNDDSGKDNGKKETFISEEKNGPACSSSGLFLKILTVSVWATLCMDLVVMWGVFNRSNGNAGVFAWMLSLLCFAVSFSRLESGGIVAVYFYYAIFSVLHINIFKDFNSFNLLALAMAIMHIIVLFCISFVASILEIKQKMCKNSKYFYLGLVFFFIGAYFCYHFIIK